MKINVFVASLSILLPIASTSAQTTLAESNPGVPWPATDGMGRKLPLSEEVGPSRSDRFVGIFYFLWHTRQQPYPNHSGPYDVTQILAKDPAASSKADSPGWGPIGTPHYWGEPLFGYYLSSDPWVLRRHAHLLADAGIDTLIFDTTNAATYPDEYGKLCDVFEQIRHEGDRTPQIAFMVNTKAGETAKQIYADLYKPGRFRDLWFHWQGKPLLLCDPDQAGPELRQFFTLRRAHWPFTMVNTKNAWHWEATHPQPYGYTDDPQQPEQVSVSVAQNLGQRDGRVTNMSGGTARGRAFHGGRQETAPGAVNFGDNFQEQWKRALELKPPFVMVTGWNEWIAGRFGRPGGPPEFVDQFNQEFSRDIEPMRGGHGDNYYWQLIANVRRYKGAPAVPKSSPAKTIEITGGFEQWRDVEPEYLDHMGETVPRNFAGVAGTHYTNRTGRNDLVAFKVARDDKNVYFYARTRDQLSPATDPNWMWLLIDADRNPATGWRGFDFIVNRTIDAEGTSWLESCEDGVHWKKIAPVVYHHRGNELHVAIPREALGWPAGHAALSFDFKWADNLQHPDDPLDGYASGDVAPDGRFCYRFKTE